MAWDDGRLDGPRRGLECSGRASIGRGGCRVRRVRPWFVVAWSSVVCCGTKSTIRQLTHATTIDTQEVHLAPRPSHLHSRNGGERDPTTRRRHRNNSHCISDRLPIDHSIVAASRFLYKSASRSRWSCC